MHRFTIAWLVLSACVGCNSLHETPRDLWKSRLEYYVPQVEQYASKVPVRADVGAGEIHRDAQYSIAVVQVPPGKEVPAHSHAWCEEAIRIVSGNAMVLIQGSAASAAAGDSFVIPAGQSHGFKNAGQGTLVIEIGSEPPSDPTDVLGAQLIGK